MGGGWRAQLTQPGRKRRGRGRSLEREREREGERGTTLYSEICRRVSWRHLHQPCVTLSLSRYRLGADLTIAKQALIDRLEEDRQLC